MTRDSFPAERQTLSDLEPAFSVLRDRALLRRTSRGHPRRPAAEPSCLAPGRAERLVSEAAAASSRVAHSTRSGVSVKNFREPLSFFSYFASASWKRPALCRNRKRVPLRWATRVRRGAHRVGKALLGADHSFVKHFFRGGESHSSEGGSLRRNPGFFRHFMPIHPSPARICSPADSGERGRAHRAARVAQLCPLLRSGYAFERTKSARTFRASVGCADTSRASAANGATFAETGPREDAAPPSPTTPKVGSAA